MPAIATDGLKRRFAQLMVDEVTSSSDSDEYFIGIGQSNEFGVSPTPIPVRTLREERNARLNLQSIKRTTSASMVIDRYNWASGLVYQAWSDSEVGVSNNPFYVITENNEVYICIQQGRDTSGNAVASTVLPSYINAGVDEDQSFETSDGYRWKFLYAISAPNANLYLSGNYVPIEEIGDDPDGLNTFQLQQQSIRTNAIPGQILGGIVIDGGSGYTSAPTVSVIGNGTGAAATATISGGRVVKIEMNNESAACGSNYDYAEFKFSGGNGSGAQVRPIVSPQKGIGFNVPADLKAHSVMINAKPDGDEGGEFIIGNDFRQIGLYRNMRDQDSDLITTINNKALQYLIIQGGAAENDFSVDKLIRQSNGAKAYIDDIQDSAVYYHQTEATGFTAFTTGAINESDGEGSGVVATVGLQSTINPFSGELLYLENRAKVLRDAEQIEDIKVVITI